MNLLGKHRAALVGALTILLFSQGLVAQKWTKVTSPFPGAQGDTALLLTDGTVLVHVTCSPNWYKLTPDNTGNYINGTWSAAIPMQAGHNPQYFASAVLADGRVVALGGEYNGGGCPNTDTNLADIYNPATNSWSVLTAPPLPQVGDGQSIVLPNGKFLVGHLFSTAIAQLDPTTLTWSLPGVAGKADNNSEEGWTLLPNTNKFLAVDANPNNGTHSEIYDPTAGSWTFAGNTTAGISSNGGMGIVPEVGPAILRPDGTVYQAGATTHNSIYTVSTATWGSAPDFPLGEIADGPATLLPSGNVLVGTSGFFTAPTHFYEFSGISNTFSAALPGTANAGSDPTFVFRFLLLPTGQVVSTDRPPDVEIYTPASTAPGSNLWRPTITTYPNPIGPGTTYSISGTQFNGLSQANAYGDDAQMATNYPLVQITNIGSGHVFYARTHDHSTMAVATGAATVSTNFDTPPGLELGPSTLVVIANGIPSLPASLNVEAATTLTNTGPTTSNYNDPVTVSAKLTAGGSGVAGKTIVFKLGVGTGTETCSATTNASGVASCSITPFETPGPYTLAESFAGDTSYGASSTTVSFTITKEESSLAFTATSATTSDYHDAATVSAQLTDPVGGAPIAGKLLTFVLGAGTGTETCSATTAATGLASCSITPNQAAGAYTLTATFAGDTFYLASLKTTPFTITKEETTTAFTATSPTVIANGHPTAFSATLKEDGVTAIAGRTITITLGTGGTAQTCTGTTDATGTASCSITPNQPLGPNTVTAAFAGDAFYLASSASESVISFAFLSSGSMIIGNLDAAVGTKVDFWGAQWAKDNQLTGGSAPNSFKGFADTAPQSCGGSWVSDPGNSSGPPTSVPSYMGVIASSSGAQSGSMILGNDPIIVVVKTNPGYGPDPGQPGTGTVVAVFCH